MAWTIETPFKVYLAQTDDIAAAFTGGKVVFYADDGGGDPGDTLATCSITSASGQSDGTVEITASAAVTAAGDPVHAAIQSSTPTTFLSTDDVGLTSGHDINVDATTWASNGTITPGLITIDITAISAAAA